MYSHNEDGNEAGNGSVPVTIGRHLTHQHWVEDEIPKTQLDSPCRREAHTSEDKGSKAQGRVVSFLPKLSQEICQVASWTEKIVIWKNMFITGRDKGTKTRWLTFLFLIFGSQVSRVMLWVINVGWVLLHMISHLWEATYHEYYRRQSKQKEIHTEKW